MGHFEKFDNRLAWSSKRQEVYNALLQDDSVMWTEEFETAQRAKVFSNNEKWWFRAHNLDLSSRCNGNKAFIFKKR